MLPHRPTRRTRPTSGRRSSTPSSGCWRRSPRVAPVVLVVEESERIDSASSLLLRHLAARLPERALLVVCFRDPPGSRHGPLLELLGDLEGRGTADRLTLRPLSEADLGDLVVGVTGAGAPADVVHQLWRNTGGNPFYATEVVRDLQARDELGDTRPWPVPSGVGDVLRHRLRALPDAVQQVVRAAAVLGREVPYGLLPHLVDQPEDVARRVARAGRGRGVPRGRGPVVEGELRLPARADAGRRVRRDPAPAASATAPARRAGAAGRRTRAGRGRRDRRRAPAGGRHGRGPPADRGAQPPGRRRGGPALRLGRGHRPCRGRGGDPRGRRSAGRAAGRRGGAGGDAAAEGGHRPPGRRPASGGGARAVPHGRRRRRARRGAQPPRRRPQPAPLRDGHPAGHGALRRRAAAPRRSAGGLPPAPRHGAGGDVRRAHRRPRDRRAARPATWRTGSAGATSPPSRAGAGPGPPSTAASRPRPWPRWRRCGRRPISSATPTWGGRR